MVSDLTDWSRYADPRCSECGGTGELRVHSRWKVSVLCVCAESWRAVHADEQRLRAEAVERFEAAKNRWRIFK